MIKLDHIFVGSESDAWVCYCFVSTFARMLANNYVGYTVYTQNKTSKKKPLNMFGMSRSQWILHFKTSIMERWGDLSRQITIIPSPKLRSFEGISLLHQAFGVTSAEAVTICPNLYDKKIVRWVNAQMWFMSWTQTVSPRTRTAGMSCWSDGNDRLWIGFDSPISLLFTSTPANKRPLCFNFS